MLTASPRRRYSQQTPIGRFLSARDMHRTRRAHGRRFIAPNRVVLPPEQRAIEVHEEAATRLDEATVGLRADATVNRRAIIAALLAHWIDRDNGLITVGHAQLARTASEVTGRRISAGCVGDHLRALENAGVLYVAQRGVSAAITGDRGRVASYLVIEQIRDHPERLSPDVDPPGADGHLQGGDETIQLPQRVAHPEQDPPRDPRHRLAAVTWLLLMSRWSHTEASVGQMRKATAVFFADGWSAAAVWHAIRHDRDGTAYWSEPGDDGAHPWRVLNWRLSRWRDWDGRPVGPPARGVVQRQVAVVEPPARLTPAARPTPGPAAAALIAELRATLRGRAHVAS